jgi:hypothetical protein
MPRQLFFHVGRQRRILRDALRNYAGYCRIVIHNVVSGVFLWPRVDRMPILRAEGQA